MKPGVGRGGGGKRCLGGSSGFWRKIGVIHQTVHLTNANAGLAGKGFVYKVVNRETCEVQGPLRVYQSTSQLLYLTSEGQAPRGPHSIFWLVGSRSLPHVKGRGKKWGEEERDEGRKERRACREWGGWGWRRRRWRCSRVLASVPWRAGALHLLSARAWNCRLMGFSAPWPPLSQHPSGGLPRAPRRASHSATQP